MKIPLLNEIRTLLFGGFEQDNKAMGKVTITLPKEDIIKARRIALQCKLDGVDVLEFACKQGLELIDPFHPVQHSDHEQKN